MQGELTSRKGAGWALRHYRLPESLHGGKLVSNMFECFNFIPCLILNSISTGHIGPPDLPRKHQTRPHMLGPPEQETCRKDFCAL